MYRCGGPRCPTPGTNPWEEFSAACHRPSGHEGILSRCPLSFRRNAGVPESPTPLKPKTEAKVYSPIFGRATKFVRRDFVDSASVRRNKRRRRSAGEEIGSGGVGGENRQGGVSGGHAVR